MKGIVEHHTDTSGFCFCTDDKHIEEIRKEGHINYNVKRAVQLDFLLRKHCRWRRFSLQDAMVYTDLE